MTVHTPREAEGAAREGSTVDQRISLASEPSFILGRFQILPSRCEVRRLKGAERLEPRTMEVLVVLARAQGRTVSREQLIERCWSGRIVTEDAVQRCIARLRRLFETDAGGSVAIETIPKVGYRLVALEGAGAEIAAPSPPGGALPRLAGGKRFAAIAGAVTFGAALLALVATGAGGLLEERWELSWAGTLTSSPGIEFQPAISPDGRAIAYVVGDGAETRVTVIRDGQQRIVPVEQASADSRPAWSPDGRVLAFVRHTAGGPCRLMISRDGEAPRQIGACVSARDSSLAWISDTALVFSDAPTQIDPLRLYALDLKTGGARALTRPPADSHGDSLPTPDRRNGVVAFRRVTVLGSSDVFSVRLSDGKETQLTRDGAQIVGMAWAPGARRLVVTSGRAGDYGLWTVDAAGAKPPRRLAVAAEEYAGLAIDDAGEVLAQSRTGEINVILLDHGKQLRPVPSTTWDWSPVLDPATNEIFYLSARDGFNEVWRASPDGALKRLTDARASLAFGLRRSPDGRRLAYAAVFKGRMNITVIDLPTGRVSVVASSARDASPPNWSADGKSLFYGARDGGGWRIWQVPVAGGASVPVTPYGWSVLREDSDGRRYGLRNRLDGLWRLEGGKAEQVVKDYDGSEWNNWSVANGKIVYLSREASLVRVNVLDMATGRRSLAGTVENVPLQAGVELLPDGRVIMGGGQKLDSDIVRFKLKRPTLSLAAPQD